MQNNETRIVIAGFGGQGVVLTGNIIARACVKEDKFVTGMVSYGVEMRGGTANAGVIVSDEPIGSPFVIRPNLGIILNRPSLDKFEPRLVSGGTIILNSSMTERDIERDDLNVVTVAASEIARELGNVRVANIVALGAFIKATGLLKMQSLEDSIKDLFAKKKTSLIEINVAALAAGAAKCCTL